MPVRRRITRRATTRRKPATSRPVKRRRTVTRRAPARRRAAPRSKSSSALGTVARVAGLISPWLPSPYNHIAKGASILGGVITGHGDYKLSGTTMAGSVPYIRNTNRGMIISNREYITDISTAAGSPTGIKVDTFPLNPGRSETFPWLHSVAQNFEEYTFKGLVFEYRTLSVDAINSSTVNIGSVFMATEYNVLHGPLQSKQEIENYEFSVSGKPSQSLMHMVECARKQTPVSTLYVRTDSQNVSGSDLRLYDMGTLNIGTQGLPTQASSIGELWVSYEIEFFKPALPSSGPAGGGIEGAAFIRASFDNPIGASWSTYNPASSTGGLFGFRGTSYTSSSVLPFFSPFTGFNQALAGPSVLETNLVGGVMGTNTSGLFPGQPTSGQVGFLLPNGATNGVNTLYFMYDTEAHLYLIRYSVSCISATAVPSIAQTNLDSLPTPSIFRGNVAGYQVPANPVVSAFLDNNWFILVPPSGTQGAKNCATSTLTMTSNWAQPVLGELIVARIY